MPDLPLYLEQQTLVDDFEAKKQEVEICLHQNYGTILHNVEQGTGLPLHILSKATVERQIELTLSKIKDIKDVRVTVQYENTETAYAEVVYTFKGKEETVIHYVDR